MARPWGAFLTISSDSSGRGDLGPPCTNGTPGRVKSSTPRIFSQPPTGESPLGTWKKARKEHLWAQLPGCPSPASSQRPGPVPSSCWRSRSRLDRCLPLLVTRTGFHPCSYKQLWLPVFWCACIRTSQTPKACPETPSLLPSWAMVCPGAAGIPVPVAAAPEQRDFSGFPASGR